MGNKINEIISKYYREAVGGIVEKAPSALNRGEGTEIDYYIYKIDLVASTIFTKSRTPNTYLKLAHTFLSAIDEITRAFGAEPEQTEYAGDGVITYFRSSKVDAIDVLKAAYYCRQAALEMRKLDSTLSRFPFNTKTVLHFGKLIMAKIGPRGDWMVSAIGPELHKACKMEKDVRAGEGRTSKEFRDKLAPRQRFLLKANYHELPVQKIPEPIPANLALTIPIGRTLLTGAALSEKENSLTETIQATTPKSLAELVSQNRLSIPTKPTPALTEPLIEKEPVGYRIEWDKINKFLNDYTLR